jgi:hypothetical protein
MQMAILANRLPERDEVAILQFQLRKQVKRFDMMNFQIPATTTPSAEGMALDMVVPSRRPIGRSLVFSQTTDED